MFDVTLSKEAHDDLERVPAFQRASIVKALEALELFALTQTRNRKPLAAPLDELPEATWEARVEAWRIFYRVDDARIVHVLRVILKGTATTAAALRRSNKP